MHRSSIEIDPQSLLIRNLIVDLLQDLDKWLTINYQVYFFRRQVYLLWLDRLDAVVVSHRFVDQVQGSFLSSFLLLLLYFVVPIVGVWHVCRNLQENQFFIAIQRLRRR